MQRSLMWSAFATLKDVTMIISDTDGEDTGSKRREYLCKLIKNKNGFHLGTEVLVALPKTTCPWRRGSGSVGHWRGCWLVDRPGGRG